MQEVYEQQKELILLGERVVLATLGFDLNVHHPYKPLVEAIKKFKVAQNALAQVAWNFVNDGLRTSLCLQFKPHHIAAGAIFLAAKFLKVKLPSDGEKVWWQEFDVTPRQLEEVSNQMLELYEQNRVPPSQGTEVEGSAASQGPSTKAPATNEEHVAVNSHSRAGGPISHPGSSKSAQTQLVSDHSYADNHVGPSRSTQNQSNDHGSSETRDHRADVDSKANPHPEPEQSLRLDSKGELQDYSRYGTGLVEDQSRNGGRTEIREAGEMKDKHYGHNLDYKENAVAQSPQEAIKKIDKDKVKAALEKRRKSRGEITRRAELMDEDDLIERELEDGIELAAESEKIKRERRQSWPKPSNRPEHDNMHHIKHQEDAGDGQHMGTRAQPSYGSDMDNVEEGEVSAFDETGRGFRSPKSSNRKRKAGSPPVKSVEGKQWHEYVSGPNHLSHHEFPEDRSRGVRPGYPERDHKRHAQENHI
ncbi:hypothetical protein RJ641_000716 [Dillenia turbinata]|uniref:Cyclin-like domain-containing protein n=1 Tax=Dillenia turbinata TaxID=194707 RepID=A0AAN8W6T3_9MAGN